MLKHRGEEIRNKLHYPRCTAQMLYLAVHPRVHALCTVAKYQFEWKYTYNFILSCLFTSPKTRS